MIPELRHVLELHSYESTRTESHYALSVIMKKGHLALFLEKNGGDGHANTDSKVES